MQGTVKWFDNTKGYGFIRPDDGSRELFVHHSNLTEQQKFKTLYEGERVEFYPQKTRKGTQAVKVRRLRQNNVPSKAS